MHFQFTHPYYLLLLIPALAWVIWFAWKSDVQISSWRRWVALLIRATVLSAIVFRRRPTEATPRPWGQIVHGILVMMMVLVLSH